MKKFSKVVLLVIMVLGIGLAVANFISTDLNAAAPEKNGTWIECPDGSYRCGGEGAECFKLYWLK